MALIPPSNTNSEQAPTVSDAGGRLARRIADLYSNDHQFRAAVPLQSVTTVIQRPEARLVQIIGAIMEGYADRPALGQRAFKLTTDTKTGRTRVSLLPQLETITYRELWMRVGAVASEWHHHQQYPLAAGDFVCTLGFASTDYVTVDLACIYLGAVFVPLQNGAPVSQVIPIIAEAQPRILAVSTEYLDVAVEGVLANRCVERMVVFDYQPEDDDMRNKLETARLLLADARSPTVVDSLNAVAEQGRELPVAPVFLDEAPEDRLIGLSYTSGSTGRPKGAMYTELMVTNVWRYPVQVPVISLNYTPMSHFGAKTLAITTLASGGTAYFAAKSDRSTLFADMALVRPTVLPLIPRVCEMVFSRYQSDVSRRIAEGADPETADDNVKAELRENLLGGRYLLAASGSAPLSAEMVAFMESCLQMHLTIGYGTTETGNVLNDGRVMRPPVVDYKLVDVPELGYFRTDNPYPRGELLVKSEILTPGYYNRPDVTSEVFDDSGYYKTGDIMAEVRPNELVYVDRRTNVLKLAQGEFVTISHLEAVFVNSSYVRQIFVYGSSERAFLLAVVVPIMEELLGPADDIKSAIMESLRHTARVNKLRSWELPRDILIETEPFSVHNGLLTGTAKLARPALKARYGDRLEQMYTDIAERQAHELHALRHESSNRPILETVHRAVQATLGCSPGDLNGDTRFIDLGGDSLSALTLSNLLTETFDIEVPAGIVIDSTRGLKEVAAYIGSRQRSRDSYPTFAGVHDRHNAEIYASDLTLDKFISRATLEYARRLPHPTGSPQTVLLTGANGYLGRFLCLEWLQKLAPTDGKLICVARGNGSAGARQRIHNAFVSGNRELAERFNRLAGAGLEVLAGDISRPNLGLDRSTWTRLADSVDLIVHPAALVNHILPYSQLFGPNVVGTAEMIRLAITAKLKPFTYVSTAATAILAENRAIDEDADIRVASPTRKTETTPTNGYVISKWASEVLVREAHELFRIPVDVFRPSMILAHSRYAGQLNVPDVFTRLLLSVAATGIAPRSFYLCDDSREHPRPHYDGLPVDFIAAAIVALAGSSSGFETYNVVNTHDDGISLDLFVDWLIQAGHRIHRVDPYEDWSARFEIAMRALPETQRQHSLLALMAAFRHPVGAVAGSPIPAEKFRRRVRVSKIGPDGDIPNITPQLIHKYITDLQKLELL
jgi:fatty acid CoA ligase FadD9